MNTWPVSVVRYSFPAVAVIPARAESVPSAYPAMRASTASTASLMPWSTSETLLDPSMRGMPYLVLGVV
jgi:hypothetical protein